MKKVLSVFLCLAMIFAAVMMLASCGNEPADKPEDTQKTDDTQKPDDPQPAGDKYEIAVVTDVGQLMDKGFNQGTYAGAQAYAEAINIEY